MPPPASADPFRDPSTDRGADSPRGALASARTSNAPELPEADQPGEAGDLTQLLSAWGEGDAAAREELARRVYPELRKLAVARLRGERRDVTFQPTELVSELMLRLVGGATPNWRSRAHFYAIAARLLRQILIDHARHRGRAKRGAGSAPVSLEVVDASALRSGGAELDLIDLERALERLRGADPIAEELISLRFYGGVRIDEAAYLLGVGRSTAVRKFRAARAYLRKELGAPPS